MEKTVLAASMIENKFLSLYYDSSNQNYILARYLLSTIIAEILSKPMDELFWTQSIF